MVNRRGDAPVDPAGPCSPWVAELNLAPHPEGGWYRRTWQAPVEVSLPGYAGPRPAATAIYFLLHPGEESRWHVVRSDELWLWHRGGQLTMRLGGTGELPTEAGDSESSGRAGTGQATLGSDRPQVLVPGGVWQTARPAGGEPVLVSCVVAPGFDMADFRML
jgi:uncharacterized protein